MPHARFYKLAVEKREQILEVAAKEFATYGYDGASLNRILEQAGVSKGAAYYYFDDKADVFDTVVTHFQQRMLERINVDVETLTADTFWATATRLYREQFSELPRYPWGMAAAKSGGKLPKDARSHPVLAETFERMMLWLRAFLRRGQELGVIRTDLPDDLILNLLMNIDNASDQWFIEHWDELDDAKKRDILSRVLDGMRRILSP